MSPFEIRIVETVVVLIAYAIIYYIKRMFISKLVLKTQVNEQRKKLYSKVVNLFLSLIILVFLAAIWGVDQHEIALFVSSVLTVMGIAFFAQWSLLSNITASLILFFYHPLLVGYTIKVLDKEYPIEGEVIDLTFFFVYVKTADNEIVTIPNSVLLQKPLVLESKEK